jgi:hypothetical protein
MCQGLLLVLIPHAQLEDFPHLPYKSKQELMAFLWASFGHGSESLGPQVGLGDSAKKHQPDHLITSYPFESHELM